MAPPKLPRTSTSCEWCKTTFEYKSHLSPRRFCSRTCHFAWKATRYSVAVCPQCGKEFTDYASRPDRHFCSKSCAASSRTLSDTHPFRTRDQRGEKNVMYGKGLRGPANGMYGKGVRGPAHPLYGRVMEQSPRWRGGRKHRKDGYILRKASQGHPMAGQSVLEHRLVMEQVLGRYLEPQEVVHHIDNNPSNNAPENLRLYSSQAEHISDAHC
jgi:endogenous inhibitor of DNA gyrase (YacG/DUF329 family)